MEKVMRKQQQQQIRTLPRWFSSNPGKAWSEKFFLLYSCCWIAFFGGIVVTQAYEYFTAWEYLLVGVIIAAPCFLGPMLISSDQNQPHLPLAERYFVKANIWIAILSFIGNYFWTHYFYNLLGARYTMPAHRLNDVPIAMFLYTHAYFCSYHVVTTVALRRFWTSGLYQTQHPFIRISLSCLYVSIMAYVTAFMETWTISSFPYWEFQNRSQMYSVGSICYGLYFIVSFPMFYRLDEEITKPWTLSQTAIDAFGACMIVTLLLDFWRLFIGGIVPNVPTCVPFL